MRWYQTWWGIALLGLGSLVLLVVVFFGAITIRFWWQIRQGGGVALQQNVYSGFTPIQGGNRLKVKVDRNVLENGDFPFLGNPNASTTIVVFGEFRCPYTKEVMPILKNLVGKYGYKIKLVFRNFPPESIHPGTDKLSQVGECAYKQGKYWEASNYLFAKQSELPVLLGAKEMSDLADSAGLDYSQLDSCLKSGQASIKVSRDYADGFRFGVAGTPTFFVNGEKVEGVVPFDVWEGYIKEL